MAEANVAAAGGGAGAPAGSAASVDAPGLAAFVDKVFDRGAELYRDLPWRRTCDPYQIWISEVMLQQTQTQRVDGRWQRWMERFPSVGALARASQPDVLDEWQGLGYNRRALAVHRAAQAIAEMGAFPREVRELVALPGIGPATAAGIRAFAFDLAGVYLETNVRTVFLHELFAGQEGVSDRQLTPLVEATCPPSASDPAQPVGARDPRTWYYALLDYGAYLKRTVPNPSRRSAGHTRQSKFEGSHRQKRAALLRILLGLRGSPAGGATLDALCEELSQMEEKAGRMALSVQDVEALLAELAQEGFCSREHDIWHA